MSIKKGFYISSTNLTILLSHFTLFISVKAITKLNLGHSDKSEIKVKKISPLALRSPDNVVVISRCCFAEEGKEMYKDL